jgi:hypothetical protein
MTTLRAAILLSLMLLLPAAILPLAPAPAALPPIVTPSCTQPDYPDASDLLAALPAADYACTEEIAAALRPRSEPETVDALLALLSSDADNRARRNALRVLGRLAEGSPHSRAAEIMQRSRAAAVQSALHRVLDNDDDLFVLQDAIWILDRFYYPAFTAASGLERIAADAGHDPLLRYRAARARARLVWAGTGTLSASDRGFITVGLASDDPGVRAAAALAAARLRDTQLTPALRGDLIDRLDAARQAAPPLALPVDGPDPRGVFGVDFVESAPTSLTAQAEIARALDRLAGDAGRAAALRAAYEALALPATLSTRDVTLRGGPDQAALRPLLARIELVQAAFVLITGPELALPLLGEDAPLTVLVFPTQAAYREYLRAFTPFTVDVDGIYAEASATLYTYRRTPAQSENTLEETLQHEVGHYLSGRSLFPGRWNNPGYHSEPKGWADEGLAELLAGVAPGDAGPLVQPRPRQLARLCAREHLPPLPVLLARREGYDRFGRFDYEAAWALSYYLYQIDPAALRSLYASFRSGDYHLAGWAATAGVADLQAFEARWHAAIGGWCDQGGRDQG